MAVAVEELVLKISLQNEKTAGQIGKINDELKDLQKSSKRTADGVNDFAARFSKLSIVGYATVKTIQALASSISSIVSPFMEAQDALTRMNQSLEIAGFKNIPAITKRFESLGESLEAVGIATTEQALKLAKIGIASGQSAEQVEKLLKVAADLSVARDIPLDAAFKALSSTLKGSAGSLAAFIPELKNLTEEQAKAGLAIEYVSKLLGGTAAKNIDTYEGRLFVLKARAGDVVENLGAVGSEAINLNKLIAESTLFFEKLAASILENKDTIVALAQTIGSLLTDVWNQSIANMKNWFSVFQGVVGTAITWFAKLQISLDKLGKRSTEWGDGVLAFGESILESGAANRQAYEDYRDGIEKVGVAAIEASKSVSKMADARKDLAKIKDQIVNAEDAKKAWEDLKNKAAEYGKAAAIAGLEGAAAVRAKTKADLEELKVMYQKIAVTGKVSAEQKKAYAEAKAAVEKIGQGDVAKIQLDSLTKIQQKNAEIESATSSIGATRTRQIEIELENQLQILDVERKKLDVMDTASQLALDRQAELLKKQAAAKKAEGPSAQYEELEKVGVDLGKNISGIFQSGAMEMIGGTVAGVSAVVQAASAALDFLPNFINNIAGLFNKLTDFPSVLLKAFSGLFSAIVRFITDFIPNLLKMIPQLLSDISAFISGFVDAFRQLFSSLPEIIFKILDDLPSIIEGLISSLISALPDILISAISFIVEKAPQIVVKIVKAVAIEIPKAIINGIIQGVSRIGKSLMNLFSGKALAQTIKIDPKSFADAGKALSDNSKRMFAVEDLIKAAEDPIQKITGVIDNAFKKGRDYVMEAWNWVLEKVLKPIWDMITNAWRWVYDNIITPIIGAIKEVWKAVVDLLSLAWEGAKAIFKGIVEALGTVFDYAVLIFQKAWEAAKAIFEALWDGLKVAVSAAFEVVQAMWDSLKKAVSIAFQFVKDLWDGLVNVVKAAFESPQALFESLKDLVKVAFKFVADMFGNFTDTVSSAFAPVKEMFGSVWKSITGAFEWAKDVLWGALTAPFNWAKDVLWDAITAPFGWIKDAFSKIFDPIIDTFKNIFGGGGGGILDQIGDALGFAKGGPVYASNGFFAPKGTDVIPAMLTPGEFVMSRPAVQNIGIDNLRAMNSGVMPSSPSVYNLSFEINIDAKTNLDESYIRSSLIPRMSEELKRASLDGKFVLSAKGIR